MMQQTVEKGGSESGIIIENGCPLFVCEISGDDGGAVFVAAADDLKQEVSGSLVKGEVPEFIENEDSGFDVFLQFLFSVSCFTGSQEIVNSVKGSGKQNRISFQTSGMTKGDAEVTFPKTGITDEYDIGMFANELKPEEVLHLKTID